MAGNTNAYREDIAREIIARIEAGTAPWQKPWEPGVVATPPFNPTTGNPYRGINDLVLSLKGYADPRWMTYKQATAIGAQVRRNEKGTIIERWQWTERQPAVGEDGKPLLDAEGKRQYVEMPLPSPKVFHAAVFNGSQIDGLEPFVAAAPAFDPIERAEAIVAGCGVPIFHDQRDRAFYRITSNDIHLPPRDRFANAAGYYATALHELGHATRHPTRLDRPNGPFGSEMYAREELRAEIASYMLGRELGIGFDPGDHAAYAENWLTALKEDRNEIFLAARDAEIIKTWVMEPEKRQALEQAAQARAAAERSEERSMEAPIARVYLNVPFAERGAVREAGARFDGEAKRWFIPEGQDPAAFAKWADQPKQQAPTARDRAAAAGKQAAKPPAEPELSREAHIARGAELFWQVASMQMSAAYADDQAEARRELEQASVLENQVMRHLAHGSAEEIAAAITGAKVTDPQLRQSVNVPTEEALAPFRAELATIATKASPQQSAGVEAAPSAEPPKRIFIAVPYAERHEAKKLGARWSDKDKSWWISSEKDPAPFEKWMAGTAVTKSADVSPIKEFADFLESQKFILKGPPIMDGNWHRLSTEGDREGQKSGSYMGYLADPNRENDRAAGAATNFRVSRTAVTWVATGAAMSAEQVAAVRAQVAQSRERRAADRRQAAEESAKRAYGVWVNLPEGAKPENSPYLAAKGVQGHGVRIARDGSIVVPKRDASGHLWGVQFCSPEGKHYLRKDLHVGTMHVVEPTGTGTLDAITPAMGGTIVITEGYATAATIFEATGRPVVVAFDGGNLEAVARAVKERHPERELLIAADNDHANKSGVNVGMLKAHAAAQAVDALWTAPKFSAEEMAQKLTDFNDLGASRGKQAVRQQIEAALNRGRGDDLARGIA